MKLRMSTQLDKRGRDLYIQQITSFLHLEDQYIACARRGGSIQIYKVTDDGITLAFVYGNNLYLYGETEDHFVSMIYRDDCIHSCSCLGKVVIQNVCPILNRNHVGDFQTLNYLSLSVSSPVTCLKLHPFHKWVSISGGKDHEVEINDFYALTHLWKSKHTSLLEDLYLDDGDDQTKWVQDLMIVGSDPTSPRKIKLILASKFGKLMLFDTTISMCPLSVLEITVNKMFEIGDHNILTLDSFGNVHMIEIESFKILQTWQGTIETGPMASVELVQDGDDDYILFIGGTGSIKTYRISSTPHGYEITPLTRFNFRKKSIIPTMTVF